MLRMSRWSTIYATASNTFVLTDVTAAVEIQQQQQQQQQQRQQQQPQRRRSRGRRRRHRAAAAALLSPQLLKMTLRARIISESQVSKTISQTKIHGKVYHLSKQDLRPYKYNGEASILLCITYIINLT